MYCPNYISTDLILSVIRLDMGDTKQLLVARKRIADISRVTEDNTNKHGGSFRSREQEGIGTTINKNKEADKLSDKMNNGRMTAIMEMPDFTQNLVKGNLNVAKGRRGE